MPVTRFYVMTDSDRISGYYRDDIHKVIPPSTEITESQYYDAVMMNANTFIDEIFSHVEPPVPVLTLEETLEVRKQTYKNESDALYMEWQYDQTPASEAVWREAVLEIKTRHPLPIISE